jgi:hemerythrin
LITYTATHFADEEKLMALHSYPELAQHKAIHTELVKQVLELQGKLKSGQAILTLDVMKFLVDWLLKHGDDKKYGVYLNSKGVV